MFKRLILIGSALAAMSVLVAVGAGCSDSGTAGSGGSGGNGGTGGSNGFQQPAGTVAVNFGPIDDTANKSFGAGEMEWKGAMKYDSTARTITLDSTWAGPFAPLFDDGPWDQSGHEPKGSTAGDHKLGVTVFATPPATGMDTYEYGLQDKTLASAPGGNGWMWVGSNGKFIVNAGATAPLIADGLTIGKWGTNDLKLVLDKNALAAGTTWDTSKITIKGSATGWTEVELKDDGTKGDDTAGDGKFTLVLSSWVGQGEFKHFGLLNSGDKPEFIWVLNGTEYKVSGSAATDGITGFTKASGGSFTAATVAVNADSKNTFVAVP